MTVCAVQPGRGPDGWAQRCTPAPREPVPLGRAELSRRQRALKGCWSSITTRRSRH